MKLWAAVVYTLCHLIVCALGMALATTMDRRVRLSGDPVARGAPAAARASVLQRALWLCLWGLPTVVFGASVGVWWAYASASAVGYAVGAAPLLPVVVAPLLWQCVAHRASPNLRRETDYSVPKRVVELQ